MNNSIKLISEQSLCSACGMCSNICPKSAVLMTYNNAEFLQAKVIEKKCVNCGKCLLVCPSYEKNINGSEFKDSFKGKYIKAYIGEAVDSEIQSKGQSGGVVTSLLYYLLEANLIEGAYVNRFSTEKQAPEVFLARNRKELISGCGSYYTQSAVLENIERKDVKKTAVVALGCQSAALELANKIEVENLPEYRIGLFCAGQHSLNLNKAICRSGKIFGENINKIRYRDKKAGGWPGNITIEKKDNKEVTIKMKNRLKNKEYYAMYRCYLCFDQMNIYSDLACGDPWGIKHENREKGSTVIITRTEKGEKLLNDAKNAGYITCKEIDIESIWSGQTVNNRCKSKYIVGEEYLKKKGQALYKLINLEKYDEEYLNLKFEEALVKKIDYAYKYYNSNSFVESEKLVRREKRKNFFTRDVVKRLKTQIKITSKMILARVGLLETAKKAVKEKSRI